MDRAEGDVRACLNTLQLLARSGRPVRVADVRAATAGHKDQAASVFSLWQDLFSDRVRNGAVHLCWHVWVAPPAARTRPPPWFSL